MQFRLLLNINEIYRVLFNAVGAGFPGSVSPTQRLRHPKAFSAAALEPEGGRGRAAQRQNRLGGPGWEWRIVGEQLQLSCRCVLLLQASGRRPMGGGESVALEFSVSVRVEQSESAKGWANANTHAHTKHTAPLQHWPTLPLRLRNAHLNESLHTGRRVFRYASITVFAAVMMEMQKAYSITQHRHASVFVCCARQCRQRERGRGGGVYTVSIIYSLVL